MAWTVTAEYDSPEKAWGEKASLEAQVPELAGFIVVTGNSITINNSTPEKAREAEGWIRTYTNPIAVTVRAKRGLIGTLQTVGRWGQRIQEITRGDGAITTGAHAPEVPSVADLLSGTQSEKILGKQREKEKKRG